MKGLLGFVAFALAAAMGVVGCSSSSEPTGPRAASVTAISGDSQVAPTGAQLAFPLSMVLLGSSGTPVQGVTVTWAATPPTGVTLAPLTSTSDANGIVTNRVAGNGFNPDLPPAFSVFAKDLAWDTTGKENCWSKNVFGTSFPSSLPACS